MQPTASRAELLLQCTWPFSPDIYPVSGNDSSDRSAANYGIKFHAAMAELLENRYPVFDPPDGAFAFHVGASYGTLDRWLRENNWIADCDRYVEVSFAYSPKRAAARLCSPPDKENHIYTDLQLDEIGGTADLVIVPKDRNRPILVLDHKTGIWGDFSRPERLAQLQVLGLAAGMRWGRPGWVPAVLHAPREQVPVVYEGALTEDIDFYLAEQPFKTAMALVGSGNMRPGPHCKRCPVRNQCPTQHADLLGKAGELVEKANLVGSELVVLNTTGGVLTREEKIGRLHLLMARFRDLDDAAIRAMKQAMRDDPELEPIRPDGKTLSLRTRKVERISKASIVRALGEAEGAKLIDELRACGALAENEEEILWAK